MGQEPLVRVFALDLSGHYSAAISLRHKTKGPTLVLINSTDSVYHHKPQVQYAFDLLFPAGESGVKSLVPLEDLKKQAQKKLEQSKFEEAKKLLEEAHKMKDEID